MLCSVLWCVNASTVEQMFNKIGEYGKLQLICLNNNLFFLNEFQETENKHGHIQVKSYYSSRNFSLSWISAYIFCKTFGMDLVELQTQHEADNFFALCSKNESQIKNNELYHIGSSRVGMSNNEFYWMTTGQLIAYPMDFRTVEHQINDERNYLTIMKSAGSFTFQRIINYNNQLFFCQRINC